MTEVLSQDEIDQLLTAISSGDAETEDTRQVAERKNIRIWDFRRPDKFSKEQIRTVSFMHETFARLTTTSLAAQLRSMVHVHVASVDQLTYEEFLRSIPSPTALAVINMDPLTGSAILEIDPAITFTIIDRLFGGPGEGAKINRELSEIERAVMESIIVRILGNMREAWSQVIDLRPRLGQIETNPQFVQIVPPTEMVVLVTLETKVEEVEGMMNFCIPYLTIEPIISKLSAQYWYSSVRRGATTENLNVLRERLAGIDIPLVAEVGSLTLPMKDVMTLQPGNVIRLSGTRVGDPMVLKLGNRPKFDCRPGVVGKKLAVQVTRKIEDIEEDEFEELATEGDEE
ncbi:MAG: flagellar motor switch protein FliM [Spirochaetes bacterium]|nr:MAG: flagellar motor switch protein FliM [Spirochaetota bacterium]RKX89927.1 MAG: flagellar motor switch protein FliM [Spirochaetota bacterium]RKX97170.1 MAG: flagellar motor switch protein FliM [Spirochaetota bacterium]